MHNQIVPHGGEERRGRNGGSLSGRHRIGRLVPDVGCKIQDEPSLLDHERIHFIIAICCGRQLHDQVLETTAASAPELQKALNAKLAAAADVLAEIEQVYDDDTDHGRKPMEQERWASRVRAWTLTATLNW